MRRHLTRETQYNRGAVSYHKSSHPGAFGNVMNGTRMERIQSAALFIRLRGDCVSNEELSKHLNMPSRGLRSFLVPSGLFVVEIRGNGKAMQPWYRLRDGIVDPPRTDDDLPTLRARIEPQAKAVCIGQDSGAVRMPQASVG